MNKVQMEKWSSLYNYEKYPVKVYEELVTEGLITKETMLVMGAWKTGNLETGIGEADFIDKEGIKYTFKNGWEKTPRTHYSGWKFMKDNFDILKDIVPSVFPEKSPEVMGILMEQRGIGFVYATFFLHCCIPMEYPLYDQHVYRSYIFEKSKGKFITQEASNKWEDYVQYKKFFEFTLQKNEVQSSILDRALWTQGKYLKKNKSIKTLKVKCNEIIDADSSKNIIGALDSEWKYINTLSKSEVNIKYKVVNGKLNVVWSNFSFIINEDEINLILKKFFRNSQDWYPLGAGQTNPIKNGLGEFLQRNIPKFTPRHASAIAAILVDLHLLENRGKKPILLRKIVKGYKE